MSNGLKFLPVKVGGDTSKSIKGTVVTVNHKTAHKSLKKHEGFQLTWHFDFKGCTPEEVMMRAADALVISCRPAFKKADVDKIEKMNGTTFLVRQIIDNARGPRKPAADKLFALATGDTETEEALLAKLQARKKERLAAMKQQDDNVAARKSAAGRKA